MPTDNENDPDVMEGKAWPYLFLIVSNLSRRRKNLRENRKAKNFASSNLVVHCEKIHKPRKNKNHGTKS